MAVGFKTNECPHVHYYNFAGIELPPRFVSVTERGVPRARRPHPIPVRFRSNRFPFAPGDCFLQNNNMFGEMRNKQGERLDYTFHAGKPDSKRIVVIGHGVTGNKDRPFVVALAEALAKNGTSALRFSFSGNGASEGKFADSTISKEVEDLGSVIDVLKGQEICYVGHSMGGAVGVIRTSRDSRIHYLVSLAGMVHTRAFAEREFGMVKPGAGFMWDDPNCPLSQAYMEDMEKIGTVVDLGSRIQVPWLLVHGTEDDVVPVQDSLDIFSRANEPKTLHQIKGSNHVFSGEFTAPMIQTIESWIKRNWA